MKKSRFEGVSRMQINEEGKVISHIDYWDAAENVYEKIPLLGAVLRFIKRKIAKNWYDAKLKNVWNMRYMP